MPTTPLRHLRAVVLSLPSFVLLTAAPPVQSKPSDVVKAFYAACNDGLYSKAEKLATKESLDYLKATFALAGALKGYCDDVTEEGTLERIDVTAESVRGEGATVAFVFRFKGGKSEQGNESLVRTAEGWRIQVLGQGGK